MFCPRCGNQADTSNRYCPTCGNDLSTITGAGKGGATVPMAVQPPQENEDQIIREALKDEYDLEKELGRGGMAVVYKARDKQLEREVAIKVLPFSLSFDAEFVERFQREARTAGKLEHPNIIPIYRVGKSGRVIYFVMKFIRGKSLSGVIEGRGAMPVPEIRRFLLECTRALGYAHKHGIVHRDIKPDNIMFDELGQAIVTDFGIAKAQSGAKLTGTGMSIGTPHYMSPEQARAQNLDGRSDIYSLGVVAYQALTGHVPFDGEDSFSIGYKHIMEELPVPPLDAPDQREMFAIVQKMMAKKPDERFQNAEELVAALEGGTMAAAVDMATMPTRAIEPMKPPSAPTKKGGPPVGATAPLPRASASMGKPRDQEEPAEEETAEIPQKTKRPTFTPKKVVEKKSKAPLAIAAVVVLAAAGGGGYVFLRPKPGPTPGQVATNSPLTPAPVVNQADTSKASTPDTSKAAAGTDTARTPTVPVGSTKQPAGSTKQPTGSTKQPTGSTKQPTATTPPPPANTTATAASGAQGTLILEGQLPPNARINVDGRQQRGTRLKLPAGSHNVEIVAQGFRTYTNRVTLTPNQTLRVPVDMPAATSTPTPPPTTGNTAPAADCSSPTVSLRNANRACWDTRPNARTTPLVPAPPSCTGTVTPATVRIQVSAGGDVVGTPALVRRSNCAAFNDVAMAQILDISYIPATKGGTAVAAWYEQQMRPAPRQ